MAEEKDKTLLEWQKKLLAREKTAKEVENKKHDLERMREEIENKKKKQEDETKKMDKINKQIEEQKAKIKDKETENKTLMEDLKTATKEKERLDRYCEELEELNQDLLVQINSKTRTPEKRPEKRNNNILIADSNRRHILNHLAEKDNDNNWFTENNTFRTQDLQKLQGKDIEGYKNIVLLLGTNNIKTGEDGRTEARKYTEEIERILKIKSRSTKLYAIEIPPIGRRAAKAERDKYNNYLHSHLPTAVKMIPTPPAIMRYPTKEILDDELHITKEVASKYAEQIKLEIKQNEDRPTTSEKEPAKEESVTITETDGIDITQIIGKDGKKVKEIEAKYKVIITISHNKPHQIKIEGKRRDTREAEKDIKEILEEQRRTTRRNEERRSSAKNKICRYFQQGNCNRGNRCFYQHSNNTTTTSSRRSRTRSPERSRRTSHRSRSPNRINITQARR